MHHTRWFITLLSLLLLTRVSASAQPAAKNEFPLKDGDIWVMAGDSITAQHLHSNYFEAFCFARYPGIKFAFRNSGVGGHTIPTTLARFDYDIAAWKPTVVSVELGMNDQGGTPVDKFIANMGTMVGRIRAIGARPVILTASPVNAGDTLAKLERNKRLNDYAIALKEYAAKENIPFGDQFHALIDIWGTNYPRERIASAIGVLRPLATDDKVAGAEHLRAFLAAQDQSAGPKGVSLQGDSVHPGPPGQLMMAAALLKDMGADGFVSSVAIDGGKLADAKNCTIDGLKVNGGNIEFDRLDERVAFPIPEEARAVLAIYPTILDLSQYMLKVSSLPEGKYTLKIGGILAGTLSSKELADGVNLSSLAQQGKSLTPIAAQGRAILDAVAAKENLVSQWRQLSAKVSAPGANPELKTQLADLTVKVEEADTKIRTAAKARKMHFEIAPAQ